MIKYQHEGRDYTATGYRIPKQGEYYFSSWGEISQYLVGSIRTVRLVLEPVPVEHTFGKVVYAEGERRLVEIGEYYLERGVESNWLGYANGRTIFSFTILEPVRFINE